MSELRRRVMMGGGGIPDVEPVNAVDYVDLGLPSGLLWAKCNVGANSETEYGNYYQYGKGNRIYQETSGETIYGGMEDPLDSSVDTATQVMGSEWRMPTNAEFQELIDNTDYTWATINGVNGGKFTSKTQPNAYVFFPAVGYYDSGTLNSEGSRCNVWSSTPSNSNTSNYLFSDSNGYSLYASYRRRGFSVRGVTSTPPTKVVFKVTTTDGTTKEGVELTVKGTNIEYTVTTNARGLVALILPNGNYTISSETHTLDTSSFVVTGNMVVNVRATKRVIDYAYITIDQTKSDPAQMITVKDGNGTTQTLVNGVHQNQALQRLRESSHLYMGYNVDGTERLLQLKDNDGTTFIDGTAADMTGGDGDHWMRIGEPFYIKRTEGADSGDVVTYGLAVGGKPDSTWKKLITPNDLIGVHLAIAENTGNNATGKLYSKSGAASSGSISQANFKTKARNGGEGFTLVTWEWHCVMAFLFWGWYGSTNNKSICGSGANSYTTTLGAKDSTGMTDTTSSTGNTDVTKFWGLENWYNCKQECVDNVSVNNYVWTVTDVKTGISRNAGTGDSTSGKNYITKLLLSENLDMIPISCGSTENVSYHSRYYGNSGGPLVAFRPNGYGGDGIVSIAVHQGSSFTVAYYGTRLAYHGDIEIVQSYIDYKYRGVDLGLPSSKIWSEVNIGASSAEQAGLYFSWGNTQGYAADSGHDFSQSTYDAKTDGKGAELTGDIPVSAEYDAAVKYCGGKWRMPTKDEFEELTNSSYTTWTYSSRNGVNGWIVTSKANGESLFFPMTGRYGGTTLYNPTESGFSRSSTYGNSAIALYLGITPSTYNPASGNQARSVGMPIRPICSPYELTLRLKDSSDNALSGVKLRIVDSLGFVIGLLTTDNNGEAQMGVSSGTYTINCGLYSLNTSQVVVTADSTFSLVGTRRANGVYIEATDGSLFTSSNWATDGLGKTANCVAIISNDCNIRVALTEPSTSIQMHSNYSDPMEDYLSGSSNPDFNTYLSDFDGAGNTEKLIAFNKAYGSYSTGFTAPYCEAYVFPDGTSNGYMPSLGELYTIFSNKSAVVSCLSACGGTAFGSVNNYYKASTFWGVTNTGRRANMDLIWSSGNLTNDRVDSTRAVRAIAKFE